MQHTMRVTKKSRARSVVNPRNSRYSRALLGFTLRILRYSRALWGLNPRNLRYSRALLGLRPHSLRYSRALSSLNLRNLQYSRALLGFNLRNLRYSCARNALKRSHLEHFWPPAGLGPDLAAGSNLWSKCFKTLPIGALLASGQPSGLAAGPQAETVFKML